ncbi:MAG: YbjQ family protein [Bacteroidota bacterium]
MLELANITTGTEIQGYRIVRNLGIAQGIMVRSRSIFGNIGASFQQLLGGNITLYSELCERTRLDAKNEMINKAMQMGANAIIGFRYDANEITDGVTEVLAYGTAVFVEKN